jgi:hypothetical protein
VHFQRIHSPGWSIADGNPPYACAWRSCYVASYLALAVHHFTRANNVRTYWVSVPLKPRDFLSDPQYPVWSMYVHCILWFMYSFNCIIALIWARTLSSFIVQCGKNQNTVSLDLIRVRVTRLWPQWLLFIILTYGISDIGYKLKMLRARFAKINLVWM